MKKTQPDQPTTRTCWRGLCLEHPADWEMAGASPPGEAARFALDDHVRRRLEVRWRHVSERPNLDRMLDRYRRARQTTQHWQARGETLPDGGPEDLNDLPEPWRGVIVRGKGVDLVHAGRWLPGPSWLVELTMVWPGRRSKRIERGLLDGVEAQPPEAAHWLWRAMGLRARVPKRLGLQAFEAQPGRVEWTFKADRRGGDELVLERLALVDPQSVGPLEEWVGKRVPRGYKVVRRGEAGRPGHFGHRVVSRAIWPGLRAWLTRRRRLREDVAWNCDTEKRLYRMAWTTLGRGEEPEWPQGLDLACCGREPA